MVIQIQAITETALVIGIEIYLLEILASEAYNRNSGYGG